MYETLDNKTPGLPATASRDSKPRVRAKSISFLPCSDNKLRRRLSRIHTLDDCQIFTINENADFSTKPEPIEPPSKPEKAETVTSRDKLKSGKRRSSRLSNKIPDISNFPLLVTSPDEIAAAARRRYSRAKSAPVFKFEVKTDNKSG